MKNCLIFMVFMILTSFSTMGQNHKGSKQSPFWIDGCFMDLDNSYIEVVKASSYNYDQARQNALNEIMKRRSLAAGSQATISINGNDVSVTSGHELIVKARVIDEYIESNNNGYVCHLDAS